VGFNLADLWSVQNAIAAVLSISQLTVYWLAGNKNRAGWVLGIAGAGPWVAVMVMSELWGLLPLVVGLQVIYIRNLVKWSREANESTQ
jgi:hypothetical protein